MSKKLIFSEKSSIFVIFRWLVTSSIFITSSLSIEIKCSFKTSNWIPEIPSFYECEATTSVINTVSDANITGINGVHLPGRGNDDLSSIYMYRSKPIRHFPQNLEKFFKNLQIIAIVMVNLQAVRQSDLKVFPRLRVLYLDSNEIEVLEKDLLAFNKRLEFVNFSNNRIMHVDVSVFRGLNILKTLWFENNECYSRKAINNRLDTLALIKDIRDSCYVDQLLESGVEEFTKLKLEFKEMQREISSLKTQNEELKLKNLRLELGKEKFEENYERCEGEKKEIKNELEMCENNYRNVTQMVIEKMTVKVRN